MQRFSKSLCLAFLALALSFAAVASVQADDDDVPQGRVAVSYEMLVDWKMPNGAAYHNGYGFTVYWDNGNVVKVEDNGAYADIQSLAAAGFTITNSSWTMNGVTPW